MYHLSTEFETVAHDSAGSESFSSLYTLHSDTTHDGLIRRRTCASNEAALSRSCCRCGMPSTPAPLPFCYPRPATPSDLPWKSTPPAAVPNDDLQSTRRRYHRRPRHSSSVDGEVEDVIIDDLRLLQRLPR